MDNWYIQHAYIQDDEAHQAPQALNEVNMDEDGADTVQHNIRHFTPFRITVDTSVYLSIMHHDTNIHYMQWY